MFGFADDVRAVPLEAVTCGRHDHTKAPESSFRVLVQHCSDGVSDMELRLLRFDTDVVFQSGKELWQRAQPLPRRKV